MTPKGEADTLPCGHPHLPSRDYCIMCAAEKAHARHAATTPVAVTPVGPCVYRGVVTLRMAPCAAGAGCGTVAVKACLLPRYRECTDDPLKKAKGVHSCVGCRERVAPRRLGPVGA